MVNFTIPDLLSCVSYSDSRSNCCRRRSVGIWATSPSMRKYAILVLVLRLPTSADPGEFMQSNELSSRLVAIREAAHGDEEGRERLQSK